MDDRHWIATGLGGALLLSACTGGGSADTSESDSFCVAEGSEVATPGGPRRIETLRVGDEVWAVDPGSGERHATRITAIRSSERECLALVLGEHALVCTPDHPVYVPESGGYEPAVNFMLGKAQQVLRVDERGVERVTVATVRSDVGVRRVFDLTVESALHNFVADGVLVHNKTPLLTDTEMGDGPGGDTTTTGEADGTVGCPGNQDLFVEVPREDAVDNLDPGAPGEQRLYPWFCDEWCPPPPAEYERLYCAPTEELEPASGSTGGSGSGSDGGSTSGSESGSDGGTTGGEGSTGGGESTTAGDDETTTGEESGTVEIRCHYWPGCM